MPKFSSYLSSRIFFQFFQQPLLHLLELPGAEGEVAGSDLIAEGLADLAHTEGKLAAGGALDILEVDENALGSLGTQVHGVLGMKSVGRATAGRCCKLFRNASMRVMTPTLEKCSSTSICR